MEYIYKRRFLKQFDSYDKPVQALIMAAGDGIRRYHTTRHAPYGLRIKKLYDNGIERTYEARVSDKIRIIWVEGGGLCVFVTVGGHDEVRHYITSFR